MSGNRIKRLKEICKELFAPVLLYNFAELGKDNKKKYVKLSCFIINNNLFKNRKTIIFLRWKNIKHLFCLNNYLLTTHILFSAFNFIWPYSNLQAKSIGQGFGSVKFYPSNPDYRST